MSLYLMVSGARCRKRHRDLDSSHAIIQVSFHQSGEVEQWEFEGIYVVNSTLKTKAAFLNTAFVSESI